MKISNSILSIDFHIGGGTSISLSQYSQKGPKNSTPAPRLSLGWQEQSNSSFFTLLDWRSAATELVGRDEELANLKSWANSSQSVGFKVISGPGGIGKSRLSAHFGQLLKDESWEAGFIRLDSGLSNYRLGSIGTLFIIDYIEDQPEKLKSLLGQISEIEFPSKTRFILLSRNNSTKVTRWVQFAGMSGLLDSTPIELGPLTVSEYRRLFNRASEVYSEKLGFKPIFVSDEALEAWLNLNEDFNIPLLVLSGALHDVSTSTSDMTNTLEDRTKALNVGGSKIMETIAEREIRRLISPSKNKNWSEYALPRIIFASAITGNRSYLWIKEQILTNNNGFDLSFGNVDDIQFLKESGILSEQGEIQVIGPGLLLTAFISHMLTFDNSGSNSIIYCCLKRTEDAINVLSRHLLDYDELYESDENNPIINSIESISTEHQDLAKSFLDKLDWVKFPQLSKLGLSIISVIKNPSIDEKLEMLLLQTIFLANLGQLEKAEKNSRKMISYLNRLISRGGRNEIVGKFYLYKGQALHNRAKLLSLMDRDKDALIAVDKCLKLGTPFKSMGDKYQELYASSLQNKANILISLDQKSVAATVISECVEMYSQLSSRNPELKAKLNNAINSQIIIDPQSHEQNIPKLVEVSRKLSQADPKAYSRLLAIFLINASRLVKRELSLEYCTEAIAILGHLSRIYPSIFTYHVHYIAGLFERGKLYMEQESDFPKAIEDFSLIIDLCLDEQPELVEIIAETKDFLITLNPN